MTPAVPFAEPSSPYPAGTTSANTNYGIERPDFNNVQDRSMPVGPADGDPGAPTPGPNFGTGTWLGEWGGRK